jgi:hypothetical protein
LTEQTRQTVDDYIKSAGKKPGEFLFIGRGGLQRSVVSVIFEWLTSGLSSSPQIAGLLPILHAQEQLRGSCCAHLFFKR